MDFIQMTQTGDSVTFSVNWEAISNVANTFTVGEWALIALGLSFVYGLITHLRSVPQIYKWNKAMDAQYRGRVDEWKAGTSNYHCPERDRMEKPIEEWGLFPIALYRVFMNLPARIFTFLVGSIAMVLLFSVSGKMQTNSWLRWGWGWYLRPHRLRAFLIEGFPAVNGDNWGEKRS